MNKSYTPKGHKRKLYSLTNEAIKVFKKAQLEGDYSREGDVLNDLVSKDPKKRCKAQKAILRARKSV